MIQQSELGTFELNETTGLLTLTQNEKIFQLGIFRIAGDGTSVVSRRGFSTFVGFYRNILRTETTMDFFNQIEVPNQYKDAVIRTKINESGITSKIQEFKQHGFEYIDPQLDLTVVPNSPGGSGLATFRTPFGRFRITNTTFAADYFIYHEAKLIGRVSTFSLGADDGKTEYIFDNAMKLCSLYFFDIYLQRRKKTELKTVDIMNYVFGRDELRMTMKEYKNG